VDLGISSEHLALRCGGDVVAVMSDLVERLRERTALKYMGNCKCGRCQLVNIDDLHAIIDALAAAPSPAPASEAGAVTVTIWASGDNENTPAEAVHHGLEYARKAGFVSSWSEPLPNAEEPKPVAWRVKDFADGWQITQHERTANVSREAGHLVEPLYLELDAVLASGEPSPAPASDGGLAPRDDERIDEYADRLERAAFGRTILDPLPKKPVAWRCKAPDDPFGYDYTVVGFSPLTGKRLEAHGWEPLYLHPPTGKAVEALTKARAFITRETSMFEVAAVVAEIDAALASLSDTGSRET
jgi:hypothetical protein